MALEEDIYEMYRDGPFDWFNPIDFMTSTLTGGPSGSWSEKTHSEKIDFGKIFWKNFNKSVNNFRNSRFHF